MYVCVSYESMSHIYIYTIICIIMYIHAYLLIYSIWLSTGIITNNIQCAFVSYLKAWTYTQWTSQLQIGCSRAKSSRSFDSVSGKGTG